jgi:hypothetical protein
VKLGHRPRLRLPGVIRSAVLGLTVVVTLLGAEPVDAPLVPPAGPVVSAPPVAARHVPRHVAQRAVAEPVWRVRRAPPVDRRAARVPLRIRVASLRPDIDLAPVRVDLAPLRVMVQFVTAPRALAVPPSARPHDVVIQAP